MDRWGLVCRCRQIMSPYIQLSNHLGSCNFRTFNQVGEGIFQCIHSRPCLPSWNFNKQCHSNTLRWGDSLNLPNLAARGVKWKQGRWRKLLALACNCKSQWYKIDTRKVVYFSHFLKDSIWLAINNSKADKARANKHLYIPCQKCTYI